VIDITDPESPQPVTAYLGFGMPSELEAYQNTMIVAYPPGFRIVDISDIMNPVGIGYYFSDENITDLEMVGSHLYTVSSSFFRVYSVDVLNSAQPRGETPCEFAVHPAYPNPFNSSTVIRFALPKMEQVKLTVYDVTGREVKVLTDDVLIAGEHRLTFDGSALASGVYFARLEAGKNLRTEKMVLLK
jgi:hypothetical protein